MSKLELTIGNQNYSSWSMRAWLALKATGLDFDTTVIPLYTGEDTALLKKASPHAKVPVLRHGDVLVWESTAIISYAMEMAPDALSWPTDPVARAAARSVAAEMHAGFRHLRDAMPMNMRRTLDVEPPWSVQVKKDLARITALFNECRSRFGIGGDFLFGLWGPADIMFAPVCSRLATYKVALDDVAAAYVDQLLAHPHVVAWKEAALEEEWVIEAFEGEVWKLA